ncbi:MAG: hypothetical protein OFPI_23980 [Osedax symbiont Rs2]|nr:MAG: hypothetical protein OFPI_23980 [Osedax symbiont Rs2]
MGAVSALDTYRVAANEIKLQMLLRANIIASAIQHGSMIASDKSELKHVAEQLLINNPDVNTLVLLSSDDSSILYEIHTENYSQSLSSLLKKQGRKALKNDTIAPSFINSEHMFILVPIKPVEIITLQQESVQFSIAKPAAHSAMPGDTDHKHTNKHSEFTAVQTLNATNSATEDTAVTEKNFQHLGALLIAYDDDTVQKGTYTILWRILPTTMFGVLIMLVMCNLLLHIQVLKPIDKIRQAMLRQQSGDDHARAQSQSSCEIDEMADTLNHMLDALKERENTIKKMAMTDPLTGLANRVMFHSKLEQAIKSCFESKEKFAVFFIDLDRFKLVNDNFGHSAGDQMLREVSKVLSEQTRSYDTVARLGGDEFAIIAIDVLDIETIRLRLSTIISNIAGTNLTNDLDTNIGASIGVAFYPNDALEPDELVARADKALYRAKNDGRGVYRIYDEKKLFLVED